MNQTLTKFSDILKFNSLEEFQASVELEHEIADKYHVYLNLTTSDRYHWAKIQYKTWRKNL